MGKVAQMQVKDLMKILSKRSPKEYITITINRANIHKREEFDIEHIGCYNKDKSGDWFSAIPEDERDPAIIFGFKYYDEEEKYEDENDESVLLSSPSHNRNNRNTLSDV